MSTMSKLYVQVTSWNNERQDYDSVGTVIYDNDPDHRLGFTGFVYDRGYLANDGPALDPVNLKTTENDGKFVFSMDGKLPPYFAQFLPGTFSDELLSEKEPRWKGLNQAEKLYLLTEINGDFGAIQLNPHLDQYDKPFDRLTDLKALVDVVKDFQAGRSTPAMSPAELRNFTGFSGHNPKIDFALSEGGETQRYVVKVNATQDSNDARISQAMNELQTNAGIKTVGSSRAELPGGDDVLLSRNYTRGTPGPDSNQEFRYNRLSLAALLSKSPELTNTDTPTYKHVADIIREVSASPQADVEELFKRAVFSALTSHTGNGLDNIEMHDTGGGNWRLSPSFNNLPNPSPIAPYELSFTGNKDTVKSLRVTEAMVVELGSSMGLSEGESLKLAQPVAGALVSIGNTLASNEVVGQDTARVASAVNSEGALRLQSDIAMSPAYQAEKMNEGLSIGSTVPQPEASKPSSGPGL